MGAQSVHKVAMLFSTPWQRHWSNHYRDRRAGNVLTSFSYQSLFNYKEI
jgi:hypothetical protein